MCTSDVTEYLFIIQSKTMDTVIIMFPNTCILLCCEMFTLSKEVMYHNFPVLPWRLFPCILTL